MIELLKWETENFGYKTGRIFTGSFDEKYLTNQIKQAKLENYRLIYFILPNNQGLPEKLIRNENVNLVDRKTTYRRNIHQPSFPQLIDKSIENYTSLEVTEELLKLAFLSGIFSRFKIDPNFSNNEYEILYTAWIKNPVNGILAKEVLVYKSDKEILGLITLGVQNEIGEIGLIAVKPEARGKSIGSKLVEASINKLINYKVNYVDVITQFDNIPARGLYESLSFKLISTQNIYHLWVD